MHGQRGPITWSGRLLLCTALLLGIVTMHSFGHPAKHDRPHGDGPAAMAAAHQPAPHAAHANPQEAQAAAHAPSDGMDPMAVCLAVLVTWTVALLTSVFLSRRPADLMSAFRARLLDALRPIPPPRRRTRLAQLSVLRI
jgi:hypothetical protein